MSDKQDGEPKRSIWFRLWPLYLVVLVLGGAYALGLQHYLSFEYLGKQQEALKRLVADRPVLTGAGYVALYMLVVAVSLPGSAVLTMAGGLLFGVVAGASLAVVGATLGAVLLFLAARYAIGDWLAGKGGKFIDKVRKGLEKDGFSYLLALRLIPVLPFWLVNLAPAMAGMRLLPFAAATFLGIIPGTAVYASVGNGIGAVLAEGKTPDFSIILRPAIILPLVGLALLALLPVAWRWWKGGDGEESKHGDG